MNALKENPAPKHESLLTHLLTSVLYTIVTIIVAGITYPLIVTLFAQLLFRDQADGSLIRNAQGTVIGSMLAGQSFSKPEYFHPRPSAAGNGYDPLQSGGTNLGPTSKKLIDATRTNRVRLMKENPGEAAPPADLVSSSASGLDPDISPDAAAYQAARIARARNISEVAVQQLISQHTFDRTGSILGEPRVNVLTLNLALDKGMKGLSLSNRR